MEIILEKPLLKYMEENNIHDIVIEIGDCIACGGAYKNVNARFLEENEDIDESLYDIRVTEMGKLYLPKEGVEYGETLRLVWKSYYWDGLGVAGANAINKS